MPGNLDRFSGFAAFYDEVRPSPPPALGPLLASYAGTVAPAVVDLGSGSGLSSRWAATWAASVTGVEPNRDMRAVAESQPVPGVVYRAGTAQRTGLPDRSADVVTAVQSFHWMPPAPTLAEVARLLRPGGVFAALDADWPPVLGLAGAEGAWAALERRVQVLEARVAAGETGDRLRRPVGDDDPVPDAGSEDTPDGRRRGGGAWAWPKSGHLRRLAQSGRFSYVRELVLDQPAAGGVERFVALARSQGGYQSLRRAGFDDADIGGDEMERRVRRALLDAPDFVGLSFCWRVRVGVTAPEV